MSTAAPAAGSTSVAAAGATLPSGNWESLTASGGDLHIAGWALDPDQPARSSEVHVYVDGGGTAVLADRSRPDVGSAFPGAGAAHGFALSVPVPPGEHRVCVYAIDVDAPSRNAPLGCWSLSTQVTLPVGNWDALSAVGATVSVAGWAMDPDQLGVSSQVHVYVDGAGAAVLAGQSRPDVGVAFPGAGPAHGFSRSMAVPPGEHRVCVYAIDLESPSRNTSFGCRSITTQLALPTGNWEILEASGDTVTVAGWSLDPDQPTAPTAVHVYVDGAGRALTADSARPDVAAAFRSIGAGSARGFSTTVALSRGEHRICVYAIDLDASYRNTLFGCRSISTEMTLPVGNWEAVAASGSTVHVVGWAFDPDHLQNAGQQVHIRIDDRVFVRGTGQLRPDVAAAFSGRPERAGFNQHIPVAPGPHTVCVSAIDVDDPDRSTAFGCRTVVNPYMTPQELMQEAWVAHGGAGGVLGAPLEGPVCGLVRGGCIQEFDSGTVTWTGDRGVRVLVGAVADAWFAEGAETGPLGYPVESSRGTGTGWSDALFEYGRLAARPADAYGPFMYEVTLY